ncbi:SIMPL domain-containing protein [Microbacterium paludicola]|uniref:SIMPL domain-containing protein n=1 Tax=Microbacterium paludicola TaxID=300019 RepID=A0A4Y9FW58_9MICO|nr:SIMPL domain-containing protein [Microbacterium paludicola]MBF0815877.1 SIMPL domain-containing protein [Microbacterium paludicola]TFU33518.1 SIMPL domain-containing protein [Microbacterium paludicola]
MVTITVEGTHRLTQPAERGTLALDVAVHGTDRDDVVRRHAEIHNELAGIARERRESGAVVAFEVGSPWAWTDSPSAGPDQRGAPIHHLTSTITLTFTNLEALTADVSAFATRADVGVQQVRWELSDESREGLLDAARVLAVQDAVRRASSYAAAIRPGVHAQPELRVVVERQVHGGGPGIPMFARADAAGVAGFTTPEIEVEAAIVATFEL